MSFGTYALIVLAGCVSVVLVGGLACWLISKQEDPGRHFKPVRERPLAVVDAQTVEFMHHLSDRCSDPPEVSCADAGCPVHGDEWHPLDDWGGQDDPLPVAPRTRPRLLPARTAHVLAVPLRHLQRRVLGSARHAMNMPRSGGSQLSADSALSRNTGPGHSLVLRRDRTVPFHTAGRLQEACATAALIAYAESILAGVSA